MAGVHYSNRLEDQAASTALNSHKEQRKSSVLDEDGKLSSASAATSLKYAQAQDLPSFPSAGLKMSSAGAAASLADSNKKSFEHWKPSAIPAANKAALLAKDYEMDPLWQPEMSAAGSKAALLAHRDTESVEIWKSKGTAAGQSAAGQAVKSKPPNAITEREVSDDSRRKALMAATGAMAGNRPRAGSTPVKKGDSTNWALKAATTSSHRGVPNSGPFASGDPGFEAARIQNAAKNNVNRQMYGSNPPVALEVEEKNRQDMLRASAVAMAKKMYAIQQTHIDEAAGVRKSDSHAAANSSHRRTLSDTSSAAGDDVASYQAPRYENLEEAARKLAQERLAKLHDEHAEYRQYYGASTQPPRSRLSMSFRRRNSTGSRDDSSEDEAQSRRIKKQMSIFQTKLADVDTKKRQADRDALLEAAHRNVEARMAKMDDQVFQETGKASPAQRDLWEQQARERAQKASDERMQNTGKVHIGGGKYLDQSEIDAIARARLQPTLDEINESAERQRARDVEIRAEQERVQELAAREKARKAEVKAEMKAAHDQEKLEARRKKDEEKQANKEKAAVEKERVRKEKEERQAVVAEQKEKARLEKEENRKSTRFDIPKTKESTAVETEAGSTSRADATSTSEPTVVAAEGDTVHDQVTVTPFEEPKTLDLARPTSAEYHDATTGTGHEATPVPAPITTTVTPSTPLPANESTTSPSKRDSKVKSWFKTQFKSSNKNQKEEPVSELKTNVGGEEVEKAREGSMRDVAMAGKESDELYGTTSKEERSVSPVRETERPSISRSSSVSSYSANQAVIEKARPLSGNEHTAQVGRTGLKAKLLKKIKSSKDESEQPSQAGAAANASDDDDFEEAKDKFEDDKLALPPSMATSNRPASPRTSHEQSKFKEEL